MALPKTNNDPVQRPGINADNITQIQRKPIPLSYIGDPRPVERNLLLHHRPTHAPKFLITVNRVYLKELGEVIFKNLYYGNVYCSKVDRLEGQHQAVGTG